ncbi:MAG: hypothetical protein CVV51_07005 [Spirochaetae bacterium HGW-Spirochaetae-7]|jgi:hypothetical protein|nr:MAG: hypothetical protein CVV51_07005 [Spirochaetae bacterium HGW-Spirochaetae-7]
MVEAKETHVPSHSILPDARRAAIEAAFDEALAEVRAAGDVALLQECRAIFRRRVPLHLRAYVAAVLALRSSGRQPDHRRQGPEVSRKPRDDRASRDGEKRKDGRPGKAVPAQGAETTRKPERNRPAGRGVSTGRDVSTGREEPAGHDVSVGHDEPRENRYRGEGVTLFVSAGRRQRFYSRIAVKILLEVPGVSGETIGDIRTMDNYSFIVVDPAIEDSVISALHGYDFKGRILAVNRARKKGENALVEEEPSPRARDDYGLPEADLVTSSGTDEYVDDTRLVDDGHDDAADDGLGDDFGRPEGLGHYADDAVANDGSEDDGDGGSDDEGSDDEPDEADEPTGNA